MKPIRYLLIIFAVLSLLLPTAAFATDTKALEQQVQELARQLRELQAQLASQNQTIKSNEQRLSGHKRDFQRDRTHFQKQEQVQAPAEKTSATQESGVLGEGIKFFNNRIKLSGLVEAEVNYSKDYDGNDSSDITLATAELDIDVDLHKYVKSHLLFLWEEDDTEPVDIDEAYIFLGNTEEFPLFTQVGKLYVPFGNYESHMISDPLTLELGETRETAIVVGAEYNGLHASSYAFNGDIDESGDDDAIKCFGIAAGYVFENDTFGINVGMGWINNLGDSDTLKDTLPSEIDDYVDGITAHAILSWQGLQLIGEYLGALDNFKVSELEFKGNGAKPEAWNIELGYTFEIASRETVFAIAYQGTNEALALELPEQRYLGSFGIGLIDGLSLAVEYAHDKDYDKSDGGTGDNADSVTMQLALEF